MTTDFGESWWNFGAATDYTISEGVVVKKLSFTGVDGSCGWVGDSEVTDKTYLHAEVFCKSNFKIKPVDESAVEPAGYEMPFTVSEAGWHTVDIPVKPTTVNYVWNGSLKKIGFVSTMGEDLYVDNVYTYEKETSETPTGELYTISLYNKENNGAYFWAEISWKDAGNAITGLSSFSKLAITTKEAVSVQNFSANGDNGIKVMFNMMGAAFRGQTGTLSFRVSAASGKSYDVAVDYTDSEVTASGSTTVVNKVTTTDVIGFPYVVPTFTGKGDTGYTTIVKAGDIPSKAKAITIVIDNTKCAGSGDWWFCYGDTAWIANVAWTDGVGYKAEITGDNLAKVKAGGLGLIATDGLVCTNAITIDVTLDDSGSIDWSTINFLGSDGARHENQYKASGDVAKIISVQRPGWDGVSEDGIYIECATGISACSLGVDKTNFYIQGAGILIYLSNFTAKETTFTITDATGAHNVVVFYADGAEN